MKVLCINDAGRPDEIPATKWIEKDKEYLVIDAIICKSQPGHPVALVLEGIDLSGYGAYLGFDSTRFRIVQLGPNELVEEEVAVNG